MKRLLVLFVLSVVVLGLITKLHARNHRERVYFPLDCMRGMHYYKGDCESQGTLVHCKEVWFEPGCVKYQP